jgi:adenine phosphoribosyltransferase
MDLAANLKARIREVKDFPEPGISYKDITTLLKDGLALKQAVDELGSVFSNEQIDFVVGIESRGFILGAPLAVERGCGFIPVRKPGKLPATTLRQEYSLEYGSDAVEIHEDAITKGQQVLVVDDVLATGGTMQATCQLLERVGANIVGLTFLIELAFLKGRRLLEPYRVESIIQY